MAIVPATAAMARRALTAGDLVTLRDIGPHYQLSEGKLFAISPDRRWLAFHVRRADPARDDYQLAMYVLPLGRRASAIPVDHGGEMVRLTLDSFGKGGFPTGIAMPIVARWARDSSWFAFLKRTQGVTQVWRAFVDGRPAEQLTRETIDVEDFAIAAAATGLIIQTRPELALARASIEREGRDGYRMDDRYSPIASSRPFPPVTSPSRYDHVELATGVRRAATGSEASLLAGRSPAAVVRLRSGPARVERRRVPDRLLLDQLVVRTADGVDAPCLHAMCMGRLSRPWPTPDRSGVLYWRMEGWAQGDTVLYRWKPGTEPRRVMRTTDLFVDCEAFGRGLVCAREQATRPRHLVSVDAMRGRIGVLYDPNPGFGALALGKVSRERWRNGHGTEIYGDLVLPASYRSGRRYPLVVVQYDSRGFLRGGTGDEFPIQLFAANGLAVLSVHRPLSIGFATGRHLVDVDRIALRDFADRERFLSAIEIGVRRLVDRGMVDPARVAITGLSEGSTSVQFAAVNSRMFAAGISTSCCWEPEQDAWLGPALAANYHQIGWPRITDHADAFWKRISVGRNGSSFPLLIEASDDEYLGGLTALTALRQRGTPAEMFVYPNEHHVKWRPAHRLAIYRRNLNWLNYWLRDLPPAEPAWREQLGAWDAYKRAKQPGGEVSARGGNGHPNARTNSPPPATAAAGHGAAAVPDRSSPEH